MSGRVCAAGLLEGAHAGRGLGHEFLRHCQRTRVLVHVVDGTSPDPLGDYTAIRIELELFNAALAHKPQVHARAAFTHPPHAVGCDSKDWLIALGDAGILRCGV